MSLGIIISTIVINMIIITIIIIIITVYKFYCSILVINVSDIQNENDLIKA